MPTLTAGGTEPAG